MLAEGRRFVIPGELIAEGEYLAGLNTYKKGDKIFASRIGLIERVGKEIRVIALKGFYFPEVGDFVIGKVISLSPSGWSVDIRAPYIATLPVANATSRKIDVKTFDLFKIYDIGDLVKAKVAYYDRTQEPILTTLGAGLGKVHRGKIVEITPTKVPRLIGRQGSMINLIKNETGCVIIVGQNGIIVVEGKTPEIEDIAILAIRKIESEAHITGLTDRIAELIREKKGRLGAS